jgi:hypothetical protein
MSNCSDSVRGSSMVQVPAGVPAFKVTVWGVVIAVPPIGLPSRG